MGHTTPGTFGRLLRQHRDAAGLTQEALAERAGVSTRAVVYLERGLRVPFPDTTHRLAEALGLDKGDLSTLLAAARPRPGSRPRRPRPAWPVCPGRSPRWSGESGRWREWGRCWRTPRYGWSR